MFGSIQTFQILVHAKIHWTSQSDYWSISGWFLYSILGILLENSKFRSLSHWYLRQLFRNATFWVHKRMAQNLIKGIPLTWIHFQDISQQVLGILIFEWLWEPELSLWDFLIRFLDSWGFERSFSNKHEIHDDPCTPDINFVWMTWSTQAHSWTYNLWSNVVWCTTDCMLKISFEF